MYIRGKKIQFDKETAFGLMQCGKDNPMYEELEGLYEELKQEMMQVVEQEGILDFAADFDIFHEKGNAMPDESSGEESTASNDSMDGKETVSDEYVILLYTLGAKVSDYIAELFEEGEYLKATLADAMADSCLFAMEAEWKEILRRECNLRKRGVARRMEAPRDFEAAVQKRALELLEGERIGVSITSGYMFSPVKTMCLLFLLSEDCSQDRMEHDCSRCGNVRCSIRKNEMHEM